MSYEFGERSRKNLDTCKLPLQWLFDEVINHIDCSILIGERGEEAQEEAFHRGASTKHWPESNHNLNKEEKASGKKVCALDAAPYPIDWENKKRFYYFAGIVKGISIRMGINIRWGGDWDEDNDLDDQTLMDLVHFELGD